MSNAREKRNTTEKIRETHSHRLSHKMNIINFKSARTTTRDVNEFKNKKKHSTRTEKRTKLQKQNKRHRRIPFNVRILKKKCINKCVKKNGQNSIWSYCNIQHRALTTLFFLKKDIAI